MAEFYILLLETYAATLIQAHTRKWLQRRRRTHQVRCARAIQKAWRKPEWRQRHVAARRIQHAWRCRAYASAFSELRKLLKIGDQADPRVLLACINPGEAALVDCAAGVHVRLRLAGSCWPPQLMYRVSTHSQVTSLPNFEQGPSGSSSLPVPDFNTWRAVRIDGPLQSLMQQWRAAKVRTRTDNPGVSYPPVVTTRERETRARDARQQKMMRLYQRHLDAGDDAAEQEDMLLWCSELRVDDYFQ